MQGHLPPAAQEKFEELQSLQDEAADVVARKERVENRRDDAEAALDALDDVDADEVVYRRIGSVRVAATPEELRPQLASRIDRLDDRIEQFEATEERLREEFENRKEDIKHLLGGPTGGPNSGTTD